MKKEFNFKGAKRGARLEKEKTKIAVSVRLDADVVSWLREESDRKAIPYQTLLNSILKQTMRGEDEKLRIKIKKILKEEKEAS